MAIAGFNHQEFAQMLAQQAGELLPPNFHETQKKYVSGIIFNFASLAGEAISNDKQYAFTAEQAAFISQIIAEWIFHKSVDTINSGIPRDYWDGILQAVAATIFEIAKQTVMSGLQSEQILPLVEEHVKKTYNEAISGLKERGYIDEKTLETAASQSNIDKMAQELPQEQLDAFGEGVDIDKNQGQMPQQQIPQMQQAQPSQAKPISAGDAKILKLLALAVILQRVPPVKAQAILLKLPREEADIVVSYMQQPDAVAQIDPMILAKYLKEMKKTLPTSKKIVPTKVVNDIKNIFEDKEKSFVSGIVQKERANVKKLVLMAMEGEYYDKLQPKVLNVVVDYLSNSV
jgi:hypothetical protein